MCVLKSNEGERKEKERKRNRGMAIDHWGHSVMTNWNKENKHKVRGGSKMVTRVQKQTAWALWLQNLTEMLEPHLVEIKHQWESKLWHPDSLALGKLFHAMLHWENLWATTAAGSKPACQTFGRPNRWVPCVM
jgi:hypothetical protein